MQVDRRDFMRMLACGAGSLALGRAWGGVARGGRPPNFVVIFTDDQGYADVGCFGAEGFRTPNLDRMAGEGVRLTDFYVAATVCTPSRAALLTGCYPKRVGLHKSVLFPYSRQGLSPDEITLAEILGGRGYATGCVGKWHLGHQPEFLPHRQGFDYFFGVPYSNDMDRHYYGRQEFQSPPLPLYRNDELVESGPDQRYLTRRYTEQAVEFMRRNREKPFFLYLAHNMPHLPLHASERFRGRTERGIYGDVIEEIDWSVGEVLKTLKELGIDDDTLVVFTSDNGPVLWTEAGSAKPLRDGKATTWEGGQRVPAVVRWPGHVPAGKTCRELVTAMDLLPTFAGLAGAPLPKDRVIDGCDVREVLLGSEATRSPREAFCYYARNGEVEAIRSGKWKLHVAKSRGWDAKKNGPFKLTLYDLEADVGERHDLAERYPEIVRRLRGKLRAIDAEITAHARPVGRAR